MIQELGNPAASRYIAKKMESGSREGCKVPKEWHFLFTLLIIYVPTFMRWQLLRWLNKDWEMTVRACFLWFLILLNVATDVLSWTRFKACMICPDGTPRVKWVTLWYSGCSPRSWFHSLFFWQYSSNLGPPIRIWFLVFPPNNLAV